MLYNAWSKTVAAMRKKRGLSQKQCAAKAGVRRVTWHRWETDKRRPKRTYFEKIMRGLSCSADELGHAYAKQLLAHYEAALGGTADETRTAYQEIAARLEASAALQLEELPEDLQPVMRRERDALRSMATQIELLLTELINRFERERSNESVTGG